MALVSGSRLGPYEILSPLGAGGMGEVYKARDTRLERTVAVNVLASHFYGLPRSAAPVRAGGEDDLAALRSRDGGRAADPVGGRRAGLGHRRLDYDSSIDQRFVG